MLTSWVTFMPCFLWIFLSAPWVEQLRENRALRGTLAAITAAAVGVVVNLALWFSLHTLFAEVDVRDVGLLTCIAGCALVGLGWRLLGPFA